MEFRIKPIKNYENARKEEHSTNLIFRQLLQVMKQTQFYIKQSLKEKEETNRALFELRFYLSENQSTFNKIQSGIAQFSQRAIGFFDALIKRQNKTEEACVEEISKSNQIKIGQVSQILNRNSKQVIKQMKETYLAPIEARNAQINLNSNISQQKPEKRVSQIKQYTAKVTNKVFSASFNMFFKEKVDFEKIKAYCSENMLGNIIETVQKQRLTSGQIQILDEHLNNLVLPYIKLSYPHSQEKQTSSKLANLIFEKDIFNENRFDTLFNSPLRKMTWHNLKRQQKNDFDNKTSREVMRLLNHIIKVPNQKLIAGSPGEEKEMRLYEMFQQDMKNCFNIVYNKNISKFARSYNKKQKILNLQELKVSEVADLLQIIQQKISKQDNVNEKQQIQFQEKVKSYTKIKIGRKISPNCQLYTKNQIQKGSLKIKDSSIRRIIVKWIQSLQDLFENPAQSTILRSQLLKLDDGSLSTNQGLGEKQLLYRLIKDEYQQIKQTFKQIKRNMYENFIEIISNRQYQVFKPQFCNKRQASIANLCTVVSRASQSYLLKYLTALINSLKKVQNDFYWKSQSKEENQSKLLLVNMKLGDLMRCQISSKEAQIISIYKFIVLLSDCNPDIFELVRVKNRFDGPNKDILINVWYHKTIMVEIQLAIKNESPFLECSDKFSHFIYQLRRDILGPLSQLASVWTKFTPNSQFFQKQYKTFIKNASYQLKTENKCIKQNHLFTCKAVQQCLPFWCSNCTIFQIGQPYRIECRFCNKRLCSMCQNTSVLEKKFGKSRKQINICEVQKGTVVKGYDIQSKIQKFYLFLQFMGKQSVYSFKISKNNQLQQIEKKYEQIIEQKQNQTYFKEFISKNYLINEQISGIDVGEIISQIFVEFWQNSLRMIGKKKINTFSLFFSSNPKIDQERRKQIAEKVFSNSQINKSNGHMEILNLQENDLCKLSNMKHFKELKLINLNFNKIELLESLKQLPCIQNIKVLELSHNKLKNLARIQSFKNLQRLNIQNNQVASLLDFSGLKCLKYLNFSHNNLGTLDGFPELNLLQNLYLHFNKLNSLKGLPSLNNLKQLSLYNNQISTLENSPNLNSLQKLYLNSNKLQNMAGFPNLPKLLQLSLSYNQISSLEGILQLPSLQTLNLYQNKLQSLSGLCSMKKLKQLNASQNDLLSLQGTEKVKFLQVFNVYGNKLKSLKGLSQLESLKILNLAYNKLESFEGCPNLISLQSLNVKKNNLKSLQGLPQLQQLKTLFMEENELQHLQFSSALTSLEALILTKNKIKSMKGFPKLRSLKTLNISYNQVENLQELPDLPEIEAFNLSRNKLKSICGLPSLLNLKELNLSFNQIQNLEDTPELSSLQILNLHYNRLQSLKGLPELKQLKSLNISNNLIESMSGTPYLCSLESLNMKRNKLNSLEGLFVLQNLKELNIEDNISNNFSQMQIRFPALQRLNGEEI